MEGPAVVDGHAEAGVSEGAEAVAVLSADAVGDSVGLAALDHGERVACCAACRGSGERPKRVQGRLRSRHGGGLPAAGVRRGEQCAAAELGACGQHAYGARAGGADVRRGARVGVGAGWGRQSVHAEGVAAVEALFGEEFLLGFFGSAEVVAEVAEHLGGVGVGELLAAELDDEAVEDGVDGDGA